MSEIFVHASPRFPKENKKDEKNSEKKVPCQFPNYVLFEATN